MFGLVSNLQHLKSFFGLRFMNMRIRSVGFWLLSFTGIVSLLTHLPGWVGMSVWGHVVLPMIIVTMLMLVGWAAKDHDEKFLRCVFLGTLGGMLGTVGYDVFRIPFHYLGLNLMSPICAYGIWLAGAEVSTYWTDLIGFAYHISNGITFGWIYALLAHRRSMWWALGWGLALETLAIVSTFGAVFGLQQYSNAVLLAYIAHLFYGWPLGVICEDKPLPQNANKRALIWHRHRVSLTLILTLLVGSWFMLVRPAGFFEGSPGVVEIGPEKVMPTWSDLAKNTVIHLKNRTNQPTKVGVRSPGPTGHSIQEYKIAVDGELEISLKEAGIYQIQSLDHVQWRSVFLAVSEQGDYRTETHAD